MHREHDKPGTRRDFLKAGAAAGTLAAGRSAPMLSGLAGLTGLATGTAALAPSPAAAQTVPAHQYSDALQKALWFYHQQRSGPLPPDQPVIWRGPSCLKDGQDIGRDLTGGYFDAGDHVKFGLPMATTVTLLCWSLHESAGAYAPLGLAQAMREAIRWGTDYFIKCHVAPQEFVYQVGSGSADHGWWGPAESVEEVMARPSYKATVAAPASTVVAATAAALAAAAVVLRSTDPTYADTCLARARTLYEFADATRSDAGYTAARGFYDSFSGFWDELAAAATWLHMATGEGPYLTRAESATQNWGREGRNGTVWRYKWTMSWDDTHYMTQILLARITGKAVYVDSVERNLEFMLPGGGVVTTPGGLAWVDKWGSLRYAANAAFLALVWAREPLGNTSRKSAYRDFGERQINYILGSNPRQSSYLIGYGNNWPRNPHHRTAHGSWINDIKIPAVNDHVLIGALVGGPDSADAYVDDRTNYVTNEVACDYNAGLVGALALLAGQYGQPLPVFVPASFEPAPSARRPEVFSRARLVGESLTNSQILVQLSNRSAWPARARRNLSLRYYFDISEVLAAGYTAAAVKATLGQHEGATLSGPVQYSGNIWYVELDFGANAIYPGGRDACERMATFTLSAPVWTPSNDYSRNGIVASPFTYEPEDLTGRTDRIPIFASGTLIAGTLPIAGEPPPPLVQTRVAALALTYKSAGGGSYTANAKATVRDAAGNLVSGATVSGRFSFSTTVFSAVTGTDGVASLTSSKFRGIVGSSYTFTVAGVVKPGTAYDAAAGVSSVTAPLL